MGFTLGDKTAEDLGILMREGESNPILPPTRDRTIVVPGRHGAHDMGAEFEARPISIPCVFVYANDQEELEEYIRDLANHLLDVWGKPRELSLIFDAEPDKTYYVRYAGSLSIDRVIFDGRFNLELVAYDPHAYGESKVEEKYLTESPGTVLLEVKGNTEAPPTITLTNEGANTIEGFTISREILE